MNTIASVYHPLNYSKAFIRIKMLYQCEWLCLCLNGTWFRSNISEWSARYNKNMIYSIMNVFNLCCRMFATDDHRCISWIITSEINTSKTISSILSTRRQLYFLCDSLSKCPNNWCCRGQFVTSIRIYFDQLLTWSAWANHWLQSDGELPVVPVLYRNVYVRELFTCILLI